MTSSSIPRQSAAGFILAAVTIALGVYVGSKAGDADPGHFWVRLCYALAALALLQSVFIWGQARGFPIRGADGHICFPHLVRNLVMAAFAIPVFLLLAAPLAYFAFELAR